jgi:cysteine desulfurase
MTSGEARVYLDHNATAPLRPGVRTALAAALDLRGNPSSAHGEGRATRRALESARAQVARLIGGRPSEIVFTSGATEANNLALDGVVTPGDALVTAVVEHASVLEPAAALEATGVRVWRLGVDRAGLLASDEIVAACEARPRLVSVSLANGEVGTLYDVATIAQRAHAVGALVHTDAAQAVGRIPVDVGRLGVDLLSLSGHKLGAPAGCGALWIRAGVPLRSSLRGGPQERDRRAGTENVFGIIGFGAAAAIAVADLPVVAPHMAKLRTLLWTLLEDAVPTIVRNGPPIDDTLPNTLNVTIDGVAAESLLVLLDLGGVAASLGSACAAGSPEPSHVLLAMGREREQARAGVRLSLGPETTEDEVRRAARVVIGAVAQIRREHAA